MAKLERSLPRSPQERHLIFERIVENSAVALAVVRGGHFLYANPGFCQMFGYTREEVVSRLSISDLADEHDRLIVLDNLSKPEVRGIDKIDLVFRARRKDGTRIRVALRGTYMELAGKATLVAGFVDVLDRRLPSAIAATDQKAKRESRDEIEKVRCSLIHSIQAVADTVETRVPFTAGHQRRVAELSRAIARNMGLSDDSVSGLYMAGLIHDIGKVAVPAQILAKPGLGPEEFALFKTHVQTGYNIVKDLELPWPVATTILQHHERLDGSGYPQGLRGDAITPEARILIVADVVEAITSRPSRDEPWGLDAALAKIAEGRGTLYGAFAVDACTALLCSGVYTL